MKNAIFFLLIALSVSSFAQNLKPTAGADSKASNPKEYILKRLKDVRGIMSGDFASNKLIKPTENATSRQVLVFPVIDSIYSWQWDTLSHKWKYDHKIVEIIYDPNNNPTSYVQQYWNGADWFND